MALKISDMTSIQGQLSSEALLEVAVDAGGGEYLTRKVKALDLWRTPYRYEVSSTPAVVSRNAVIFTITPAQLYADYKEYGNIADMGLVQDAQLMAVLNIRSSSQASIVKYHLSFDGSYWYGSVLDSVNTFVVPSGLSSLPLSGTGYENSAPWPFSVNSNNSSAGIVVTGRYPDYVSTPPDSLFIQGYVEGVINFNLLG